MQAIRIWQAGARVETARRKPPRGWTSSSSGVHSSARGVDSAPLDATCRTSPARPAARRPATPMRLGADAATPFATAVALSSVVPRRAAACRRLRPRRRAGLTVESMCSVSSFPARHSQAAPPAPVFPVARSRRLQLRSRTLSPTREYSVSVSLPPWHRLASSSRCGPRLAQVDLQHFIADERARRRDRLPPPTPRQRPLPLLERGHLRLRNGSPRAAFLLP